MKAVHCNSPWVEYHEYLNSLDMSALHRIFLGWNAALKPAGAAPGDGACPAGIPGGLFSAATIPQNQPPSCKELHKRQVHKASQNPRPLPTLRVRPVVGNPRPRPHCRSRVIAVAWDLQG